MNIFERIKVAWNKRCMRQEAREEANIKWLAYPGRRSQIRKEIDCLIDGHQWSSTLNPKAEMKKDIKDRVYCKRCGIKYHQHEYK